MGALRVPWSTLEARKCRCLDLHRVFDHHILFELTWPDEIASADELASLSHLKRVFDPHPNTLPPYPPTCVDARAAANERPLPSMLIGPFSGLVAFLQSRVDCPAALPSSPGRGSCIACTRRPHRPVVLPRPATPFSHPRRERHRAHIAVARIRAGPYDPRRSPPRSFLRRPTPSTRERWPQRAGGVTRSGPEAPTAGQLRPPSAMSRSGRPTGASPNKRPRPPTGWRRPTGRRVAR